MNLELAKIIMVAGKTVNFLKKYCDEHYFLINGKNNLLRKTLFYR